MGQRLFLKNLTTFDEKRIHFGFTLGVNTADLAFTHYNTLADNPLFVPEDGFSGLFCVFWFDSRLVKVKVYM